MEAEAPFVKPLYLVSGIDTPVGIIVLTALQDQEHHQLQVLEQGLEKMKKSSILARNVVVRFPP